MNQTFKNFLISSILVEEASRDSSVPEKPYNSMNNDLTNIVQKMITYNGKHDIEGVENMTTDEKFAATSESKHATEFVNYLMIIESLYELKRIISEAGSKYGNSKTAVIDNLDEILEFIFDKFKLKIRYNFISYDDDIKNNLRFVYDLYVDKIVQPVIDVLTRTGNIPKTLSYAIGLINHIKTYKIVYNSAHSDKTKNLLLQYSRARSAYTNSSRMTKSQRYKLIKKTMNRYELANDLPPSDDDDDDDDDVNVDDNTEQQDNSEDNKRLTYAEQKKAIKKTYKDTINIDKIDQEATD